MIRLAKIQHSSMLHMLTNMCLCQVKEQLNENIFYSSNDLPGFVYNEQFFSLAETSFFHTESFMKSVGYEQLCAN